MTSSPPAGDTPALAPDHRGALCLLADVYLEQAQGAKAVILLEGLTELWPGDPDIIKALAYAYLVVGEYERALKMVTAYRQRQALTPDTVAILLIQGRALLGLGRIDEARAAMGRYLKHTGDTV